MRRLLALLVVGLPIAAAVPSTPLQAKGVALQADIEALTHKKKEMRLAAVLRIGTYGAGATLAVPELGRVLQEDPDSAVADQAALTLAKIGPDGVKELVRGTKSLVHAVRYRSLVALGKMGPAAKEARQVLEEALTDSQPACSAAAAVALGELGADAVPAIPALCRALHDCQGEVRKQAAVALANIGSAAVPSLVKLLEDDDWQVRVDALEVLCLLGPKAKMAVGDLIKQLDERPRMVRRTAALALGNMGAAAKEAAPELMKLMKDDWLDVQQAAFQALLLIHGKDVGELLDDFQKLNAEHHWAAPYVLKQFGPNAKDAVKPLVTRLQTGDDNERLAAALALVQVGNDAKDAIPALQKALQDSNPLVQQTAAVLLISLLDEPSPDLSKVFDEATKKTLARQALALAKVDQKRKQWLAAEEALHAAEVREKMAMKAMAEARKHWLDEVERHRPVNRQALADPQLQAYFDHLINMHIMLSTWVNRTVGNGGCLKCVKNLPQPLVNGWEESKAAIAALPKEAVPALIRGLYLQSKYDLGFS